MTLLSFLLLVILFLTFFIYFSELNPGEISIVYFDDQSFVTSVTILVIGCVMTGLALGMLAHGYHMLTHQLKHWRHGRREKKAREIAAIYREGVSRLLSGDLKKAHALLQKVLDRDPARVESYIAMADVFTQEGEPQQAINLLFKAREIDPKSMEVLFKLAATCEQMDQPEEAAQVYEEILSIEGGNRKALRSLRDMRIRQGAWEKARELQKRVVKASQGSKRQEEEQQQELYLRYEVARAALTEGEAEKALSTLKDLVKSAPQFVPGRVSLGDALQRLGRTEEAAAVWQEGYRKLQSGVFLARLEDLYMDMEDPSALLAFYRSEAAERVEDLMLRLFYGKFCLRLEMVDEALDQLQTLEGSGIEVPQLHLLLAEANRRRDRIDEAIDQYQKALGVDSQLRLGFTCEKCQAPSRDWQSRCDGCGSWGSLVLAGRQQIHGARPMEARAIHHGER